MMHDCITVSSSWKEVTVSKKEKPERRISIRSVRKDPPDLGKLGRALIALAMAQNEAEAQAQNDKEASESDGEDAA
jgi:tRNA U34 5-methylaminomethyl-2-thiouridine-forming methyltransferase MnmC